MKACLDTGNRLGLKVGGAGYSFAGTLGYAKGCYAYLSDSTFYGRLYYGLGATEEEMNEPLPSPRYRPVGYDSSIQGERIFSKY